MAAMLLPHSVTFKGKEIQLWNYEQLLSIGDKALNFSLKARAMTTRDIVGADRPIAWISGGGLQLRTRTGTPGRSRSQ